MIEILADCYFYNFTHLSHIYLTSFLANRLVSELVIKEIAYSNERVYNCSASNFFKDKRRTDFDFVDVTVGKISNTRKYFLFVQCLLLCMIGFSQLPSLPIVSYFASDHSKSRF